MGLPDFGRVDARASELLDSIDQLTEALKDARPKSDEQHSRQFREWERFALTDGVQLTAGGAGTIGTSMSNLRPAPNGWEAYITSVAVTINGASAAATVVNYNGEVDPTNLFDYANAMLGNSPSRIIAFYEAETVYVESGDAISIVIAGGAASVQAWARVTGKRRML